MGEGALIQEDPPIAHYTLLGDFDAMKPSVRHGSSARSGVVASED
jgi:hypothetical protein